MEITHNIDRFISVHAFDDIETNFNLEKVVREFAGKGHSHISGLEYNVQADITHTSLELEHNAPEYQSFFNFFNISLGKHVANILEGKTPFEYNIISLWGAVYNQGDYARSHRHGACCISFCYYVSADDSTSSPLNFDDYDYSVPVNTGTLIIFPGWMNHSVNEYKGNNQRIVVAGNVIVI